jgi:hypothetical protein
VSLATSPFRVKNVTISPTGPSLGLERVPGEREIMTPLFIELSNRRALLYAPGGRPLHHADYIRGSVEQIRAQLVETRKQLKGGGDAAEWLDAMTKACRDYLDAVEEFDHRSDLEPNFEPALRELREFFRGAAVHFANDYDLFEARKLAQEMYREDLQRLEAEMERAGLQDEPARDTTRRLT